MLSASVMYPLRGAAAWKSTVGANVASDALANLASGGVTGGTMIIVGEDYGEGSSITERTHAFAMKSQMWLLDPRPDHECIVNLIEKGFELSELSNTPVMLEVRVRACHMRGSFACKDNVKPAHTIKDALNNPKRDVGNMRDTLKEALTTKDEGPKVIVASSECMLNKQRRVKPQMNKAIKDGVRVVRERFGVDEDVCTGPHGGGHGHASGGPRPLGGRATAPARLARSPRQQGAPGADLLAALVPRTLCGRRHAPPLAASCRRDGPPGRMAQGRDRRSQQQPSLGVEILQCRRLVKGYSDTRSRGLSKFDKALAAIKLVERRDDAADWARHLQEAALKDSAKELDGVIQTIKTFAGC
jgi:hypothetical protein